jgi:hypothetical protein
MIGQAATIKPSSNLGDDEMHTVLYDAPSLACPASMGLMMWFMGRGMRGARASGATSLPELRAQRGRLGAALDERVRAGR